MERKLIPSPSPHIDTSQGSMGEVYRGFLYDRAVACKVLIKVSAASVNGFLNEATLLSICSHPSIIRLIGVCLDPEEPKLIL